MLAQLSGDAAEAQAMRQQLNDVGHNPHTIKCHPSMEKDQVIKAWETVHAVVPEITGTRSKATRQRPMHTTNTALHGITTDTPDNNGSAKPFDGSISAKEFTNNHKLGTLAKGGQQRAFVLMVQRQLML